MFAAAVQPAVRLLHFHRVRFRIEIEIRFRSTGVEEVEDADLEEEGVTEPIVTEDSDNAEEVEVPIIKGIFHPLIEDRLSRERDRDRDSLYSYKHPSDRNNEGMSWTRRSDEGFTKSDSFASMANNPDYRDRTFSSPPSNNRNNDDRQTHDTAGNSYSSAADGAVENRKAKTSQSTEATERNKRGGNDTDSKKKEPQPIKVEPPPKGKTSGIMLALVRLLELEASMEYAYTKHMLLKHRQKELQHQTKVLESLPVGLDAIKDDLEKISSSSSGR